ncbi:MAG: PDZ domain-containing protein, partial [Fimbriimonadales bacterium]|nr:PDZ domain-containing protein [Fimbriimonadales bacterium]
GMLIMGVERNSLAEQAGLRPGDVLTAMNGRPLTSIEQFQQMVRRVRLKEKIRFTVWREGRTLTVEVTPVER